MQFQPHKSRLYSKTVPLNLQKAILGEFFIFIKYELRKSSFRAFNNMVDKHKYYTTKWLLYIGLNIHKNYSKQNLKVFARRFKIYDESNV